jgi:hypothetical protein
MLETHCPPPRTKNQSLHKTIVKTRTTTTPP